MRRFKSATTNLWRTRLIPAYCLMVWWGPGAVSDIATAEKRASQGMPSDQTIESASDSRSSKSHESRDLSVGNNRIRFYFSQAGKWLGIFPSWAGGRSLFESGGVFVLASNEDGNLRVIANTLDGTLRPNEVRIDVGKCCEGIKGGNRAPAPNPDDDRDGRTDEDRLDGIDNDGDGLADEDFAAIGDEMVVAEFRRMEGAGFPALSFHQESYAWALPHIEGMVAVRLLLENDGEVPLRDVRIGAFFQKKGPCTLVEEVLTNRANLQADPEQARAIISRDPNGTAVGLVFPETAGPQDVKAAWTLWSSGPVIPLEGKLEEIARNEAAAMETPGIAGGTAQSKTFDGLEIKRVDRGTSVSVGGISPDLGDLAPGERVEITIALVIVPKPDALERALVNVHRTYIGDGTHRFIPPPVPVTPFMIWGTYEKTGEPQEGLRITLERHPTANVDPTRIVFLSGVDLADLEVLADTLSGFVLRINGASAGRLLRRGGERIVLKGRDDTGAFFDAILNPAEEAGSVLSAESAERFWKTAGKLPEDLLSGSPNPFREQTTLYFEVPSILETDDGTELRLRGSVETSLKVYDVTGRLVSVLVDDVYGHGSYQSDWHAIDEYGNPVASGVYYVKLQLGKRYITKRIILLK
ncbi:MAG: T9SS type A sorting domain-containing protein [Candidatus Latescibacteria bacterium]|nr:T9SS type A sorting domain-containing protein [Candidatus Latescibacterota bacterium]NIM22670.1 T9SS type A sorting domain-containing protein [Candidatus Latescibacterota bacterium]NIM64959.1 T9SS type A sorting domain-containing protein [Candidatus Latescibacterota bacterium]NIO01474.1 T9SS type A sorting domain-containing protein [Candidatus Latescibacterota bacterium]NIO27984.1 T9SS type A sorting domain-containing protein [Candidatus Latescibacterota bacterium]